jgi:alpha-L-fucosidase
MNGTACFARKLPQARWGCYFLRLLPRVAAERGNPGLCATTASRYFLSAILLVSILAPLPGTSYCATVTSESEQAERRSGTDFPTTSQQNGSVSTAGGRDDKAIEEALRGWWTASMKSHDQRIAWWRDAQFGCFIHWGVYSSFGGEWKGKPFRGYAEHMMRSQKIPLAEYKEKVVSVFNPIKFNADEWVRLIKAAGMKYVIITAKHHDGFAMYPSAVTRYNIRDATPFKRDPIGELAAACRRSGIRFGFYYSHAFDWEHPDAPGNDWDYDNPGGDKGLHGGVQWYDQHPELLTKARRYVDEKAIPQIVELLKNYHPDILWFDTPSKLPLSENLRILKVVRATDLKVVVNGRLARGQGHSFGDYKNTGDRAAELVPTEGDWETIPTTNESYGYHKYDLSHKPPAHFIQLLAKAAARGGNVLMNIGPMGNGQIDPKDQEILRGIGKWMAANGSSIYRSERTPLPIQAWGESTRKGNTLYLHVFDWPRDGKLIVGGLKSSVARAYLLSDAKRQPLHSTRLNENDVVINVPTAAPNPADTVVTVEIKNGMEVNPVRLIASRDTNNVLRAFDGELHGKGLRFGDGKAPRAYVFEWKDPQDWVGWKIRMNEPSEFDVSLKYTTGSTANRGSYNVTIGDQVLKTKVEPTTDENQAATATLGRVKLNAGEYEIMVKPLDIQGGELMRMFHLALRPVQAN